MSLIKVVSDIQDRKECIAVIKEELLKRRESAFLTDKDRATFLHHLLNNDNPPCPQLFHELVQFLIDNDLKEILSLQDTFGGNTPIHFAVNNIQVIPTTIQLLYENGADFNKVDKLGTGALSYAVEGMKDGQFLSLLVSFGADFKQKDIVNNSLLHDAAKLGNLKALKFFLESGKFDLNEKNDLGETPLLSAASSGNDEKEISKALLKMPQSDGSTPIKNNQVKLEIIKLLIEAGADVFPQGKGARKTFLHELLEADVPLTPKEFHDLAEFLIERDLAELFNAPGGLPSTPPFVKALHTIPIQDETLSILLMNGVDIKAVTKFKEADTWKRAIQLCPHPKVIANILKCGANPNFLDEVGNTLLGQAAEFGHVNILSYLLDLEVIDIDHQNKFGNSALHSALLQNKEDVLERVKLLLDHGAGVNSKNQTDWTPLRCASQNVTDGTIELIKLLIDNGADVFQYDDKGWTFLHVLASQHIRGEARNKWDLKIYSFPRLTPEQFHSIAEFLIEKGLGSLFEDNSVPRNDATPLVLANYNFNLEERTLKLLDSVGIDLNFTDSANRSILSSAIFDVKNINYVRNLIENGCDINKLIGKGCYIIHHASLTGSYELLKMILDFAIGKDLSQKDNRGDTPLHLASKLYGEMLGFSEEARVKKIKLLLDRGADPKVLNAKGETPLSLALEANVSDETKGELMKLLKVEASSLKLEGGKELTTNQPTPDTEVITEPPTSNNGLINEKIAELTQPGVDRKIKSDSKKDDSGASNSCCCCCCCSC